jgi:hypothetical protein
MSVGVQSDPTELTANGGLAAGPRRRVASGFNYTPPFLDNRSGAATCALMSTRHPRLSAPPKFLMGAPAGVWLVQSAPAFFCQTHRRVRFALIYDLRVLMVLWFSKSAAESAACLLRCIRRLLARSGLSETSARLSAFGDKADNVASSPQNGRWVLRSCAGGQRKAPRDGGASCGGHRLLGGNARGCGQGRALRGRPGLVGEIDGKPGKNEAADDVAERHRNLIP